jgi:hypothetical protein
VSEYQRAKRLEEARLEEERRRRREELYGARKPAATATATGMSAEVEDLGAVRERVVACCERVVSWMCALASAPPAEGAAVAGLTDCLTGLTVRLHTTCITTHMYMYVCACIQEVDLEALERERRARQERIAAELGR